VHCFLADGQCSSRRACGKESQPKVAERGGEVGPVPLGLVRGKVPVDGNSLLGCRAGLAVAAEIREPEAKVGDAGGQLRTVAVRAGFGQVTVDRDCFFGGG